MKIAILGGTGSLGKGLASRWIKAGHDVLIGSRDLPKAQEIAVQLGLDSSSGMLNIDAAKTCELACLTVPFAHQESTLISIEAKPLPKDPVPPRIAIFIQSLLINI